MEIIRAEGIGLRFSRHRTTKSLRAVLVGGSRVRPSDKSWFWALRGVSFTVQHGETLGVIGRNGSGKTSLLRLLGRIFAPDEGTLTVEGSVSTLLSVTAGFQPELTGTENIHLSGAIMGFTRREIQCRMSDIADFSELGDFVEDPVRTYSSGMTARLGFSIAIHLKRDVMLVDEVLGVGDASFKEKSALELRKVMKEKRTVVLSSHNMDSIKSLATQAIWLDHGQLRAIGEPDDVVAQYLSSYSQ